MARMSDTSAIIRVVYGGGGRGFNGRKLDRRASGAKQIVCCVGLHLPTPPHPGSDTPYSSASQSFNFSHLHSAANTHPLPPPHSPPPPNICDDAPSPGRSRPRLIDATVAVIECASSAVRIGQTRHTVLCIECVFVLRWAAASKLH